MLARIVTILAMVIVGVFVVGVVMDVLCVSSRVVMGFVGVVVLVVVVGTMRIVLVSTFLSLLL